MKMCRFMNHDRFGCAQPYSNIQAQYELDNNVEIQLFYNW